MGLFIKNMMFGAGSRPTIVIDQAKAEYGEFVAIVGPMSSGKSLLLGTMAGALKPSSGVINYFHKEKYGKDRSIGFRPEGEIIEANQTVGEYLMFCASIGPCQRRERVKEVFGICQDLKIEAQLNQRVEHLDQGEATLVSIAGLVLRRPQILLLDEPYAGLDDFSVENLNRFLTEFLNDRLIVVTSRTLHPVPKNAKYWFLKRGRLLAHGSRNYLLAGEENKDLVAFYRRLMEKV